MIKKSSPVMTVLLLIFLAVMTTSFMVHANPVEGTYLSMDPPVYVAEALGEAFTININISNVQNLRVFEFKLGYNTTLLDAVEVAQGLFFPSPPKASIEKNEINEAMGFVWVRISLSSSEPTRNGSGTLATITFKVTFAPIPPEKACGVLDLHDTLLYDDSMTTIIHDSTDGLYFWKSIQADPPVEGRLLDLSTQKGGIGQGFSGGTFTLGEMVESNVNLTYNDYPVQSKLVALEVLNPKNETILIQVAITNSEGSATIDFEIPSISESLGTWTAIATADVADKAVWDFLTFDVIYAVPPHGPKAEFTVIPDTALVGKIVKFNASRSLPGWNGTHQMPITEYRWDFGDGNKTTTPTPIVYHSFSTSGIYYVTLTVYAPRAVPETDTVTHKVTVVLILVGGYSASMEGYTTEKPLISYLALVAVLTVAFTAIRRKTQRRTKHSKKDTIDKQ